MKQVLLKGDPARSGRLYADEVRLVRSSGAAQSWEWPVDLAVSAVLTFAVLAELVLRRSADPIDFVAAPVLTSTVAWRRRAPQLAVVVGLCAALVLRDHD